MSIARLSAPAHLLRVSSLVVLLVCGSALAQQSAAPPASDGPDPALANMAPGTVPATAAPQDDSGYQLQQSPAPIVRSEPVRSQPDSYNAPPPPDGSAPTDNAQSAGDEAAGLAAINDTSLSVDSAPPPLPQYDQPAAPGDGYAWTPGYWGYADVGYYWVPGVWINPPYYGALWTPSYWGYFGGRYRWHPGYWGLHIGFYGGIDYGYGYIGTGYFGGYWAGNTFFYNTSVTRVGANVSNVYTHTVVYNNHVYGPGIANRVSYNGGRGGIAVAPRPAEMAAMHESHVGPLAGQVRLHATAAGNPQAAFTANHGTPSVAAQSRPLGATRTVSPDQSTFQRRGDAQPNAQQPPPQSGMPQRTPSQPQSRQPQQQPQYQPQTRPAPSSAPAPRPMPQPRYEPQSRPAPPPSSNNGKH